MTKAIESLSASDLRLAQSKLGIVPLRRRPVLLHDGDSKAFEPIQALAWAQARRRFNLVFGVSVASGSVGGSTTGNTGNNLTNATRLAAMVADVAARVAAGQTVDAVLTIGTNDMSNAVAVNTVLANVLLYISQFQAAGGRYLWLMAVDPRGSTAPSDSYGPAYNVGYRQIAETIPGVFYVDTVPWLIDPVDAFGLQGGGALTAFVASNDASGAALHLNSYGNYLKSYAVEEAFAQVYGSYPLLGLEGSDFMTANAARANRMNVNYNQGGSGTTLGTGRMIAIGGTSSITNSGSGSITGTPPLGWTATGTLTGDMGLTFATSATGPALEAEIGQGFAQKGVAITFGGTPGGDGSLTLQRNSVQSDTGAAPVKAAALFECDDLAGVFGMRVALNTTPAWGWDLGSAAAPVTTGQLPTLNGLFNPSNISMAHTAMTNHRGSLSIYWKNGVPISGTIIMYGVGVWVELELPTSA